MVAQGDVILVTRAHRGLRRHIDERMQRIKLAALHKDETVPRREGGDHLEPQMGREEQLVLLRICNAR